MRRVLIPSDNRDFVPQLAAAYGRRGWDVAVGVQNFDLLAAHYDLVHLQWPEELCDWKPPEAARLAEIAQRLEAWGSRSRLLLTVHNLFPHRAGGDAAFRQLLETCYARISTLAHFTEASQRLVNAAFPISARSQNVVTGFFNFDYLRPAVADPAKARAELGLAAEDFVVLVFGALRDWAEVQLVRTAFAGARMERKRLLMAGRYQEFGPVWRQRWRRWSWARWLRHSEAVSRPNFVPDTEVHFLVEAADAILVPRFNVLNSGLTALAMSFGKILIAPDNGSFPELIAGTKNPLYHAGDAMDCARALETAAALDRPSAARENRALAETWSWDEIVGNGLKAAGFEQ